MQTQHNKLTNNAHTAQTTTTRNKQKTFHIIQTQQKQHKPNNANTTEQQTQQMQTSHKHNKPTKDLPAAIVALFFALSATPVCRTVGVTACPLHCNAMDRPLPPPLFDKPVWLTFRQCLDYYRNTRPHASGRLSEA